MPIRPKPKGTREMIGTLEWCVSDEWIWSSEGNLHPVHFVVCGPSVPYEMLTSDSKMRGQDKTYQKNEIGIKVPKKTQSGRRISGS
jgi:hypothetical protein